MTQSSDSFAIHGPTDDRASTGNVTRRSVMKGAAALAGLAALGGPTATAFAASGGQTGEDGGSRANVLLVHGIWADGSSWSRVIPILQKRGHNVVAVQLGLRSLAEDVAWTKHVLADRLQGPTVLVGHSYGGMVISGAGVGPDVPAGKVTGLVFASAFAPDEGESAAQLVGMFPASPGLAHIQPDTQGFLWLDPAAFPANFVQDIELDEARVLAAAQKPGFGGLFADMAGPAAWKTLPSWHLVSTLDRMINPDLERFMARRTRARTIVEVPSSHASPVSHPRDVARLILAAASFGMPA
jgi:pimeloyl-ACP methyl ester carboxylesterase